MRRRFWFEAVLGALSGALFVSTVLWPDWIELVFGVDPDRGNGSAEWVIVGLSALASITCSVLVGLEWRRRRAPVLGAT